MDKSVGNPALKGLLGARAFGRGDELTSCVPLVLLDRGQRFERLLVEAVLTSNYQHLYGVPVTYEWLDEGLRQMREREEQHRLASERRLRHTAVIKEKGPDLMRRLVAEVGALVHEYRQKTGLGSNEIEFEALPGEGFCVTKAKFPRVSLECRPGYETHIVYCNMTRTDNHENAPREWVFSMDITVDDSNKIVLRHEKRAFETSDEVVEFLLKPVLFPPLN